MRTAELDLIVLNTAPLSLTGRILQNKKVLVDKDPHCQYEYESLTLRIFFLISVSRRRVSEVHLFYEQNQLAFSTKANYRVENSGTRTICTTIAKGNQLFSIKYSSRVTRRKPR